MILEKKLFKEITKIMQNVRRNQKQIYIIFDFSEFKTKNEIENIEEQQKIAEEIKYSIKGFPTISQINRLKS